MTVMSYWGIYVSEPGCFILVPKPNYISFHIVDYQLADLLGRKRHFAQSLEFSGQALLIRVNNYGIVHEKTAESHFALGMLYRHLCLFEKSRQELFICKFWTTFCLCIHSIWR